MEKSAVDSDLTIEKEGIPFLLGSDIKTYVPSVYIDYYSGIFGGGYKVFAGGKRSGSC